MRNLAVNNLVLEVAHATYSASHLTARCASKAFSAGLAHRLVLHFAHGDSYRTDGSFSLQQEPDMARTTGATYVPG